jgi:conjugative relaxase-like TrwC/TraI family protein
VVVVISVAMLGGGADAAGYYLDRSADCDGDLARYYAGEQERPGRWCGAGAAALGLSGVVQGDGRAVFAGLLDGRLPDGTEVARPVWRADPRGRLPGAPLVRELRAVAHGRGVEPADLFIDDRLAATARGLVERVEASPHRAHPTDARLIADLASAAGVNPHALYPKTNEQRGFAAAFARAGEKVDARRCGLDVVVSAPKSVSVLYGLAAPDVAASVLAAHERAVGEALDYLGRHTAHGLRGHQGDGQRCARVHTEGFVGAAFTHRTSRADDPQLHTHLVIANAVRGLDGKWSAVDSRAVHRHARTAGCIYQAVLRGELTRELGVEWSPVRRGVAEIAGIPRTVLRHFSTRRVAIEAELDKTAGSGRRAAQRAAYVTRPAKTHTPELSLRERWAERVRALGHDATDLVDASLYRGERLPALPDVQAVARELFGPSGLTARQTSFDRRDVIQALSEVLPTGLSVTGRVLEGAAGRMLRDSEVIPLLRPAAGAEDGPRYSTADLLATERYVLALADEPCFVPVAERTAAQAANVATLSPDQRRVVRDLLTSPATIDVVAGPAGTGKTALLRAAKTGWDEGGTPVVGCALAAVTARRLEAATGIPASSITRFLSDLSDPDQPTGPGLARGTVVVVDEASMVGTRDMATLARHVHDAGGKLVLVGDPAQLPEIDAGGIFAALADRAEHLTDNRRQAHAWERQALLDLRAGNVAAAIDAYLSHQRITIARTAQDARADLVKCYLIHRSIISAGPYDTVALASTRRDVAALNIDIRAALQNAGKIGPDAATVRTADDDVRHYATGDLVVVTANDYRRGLLNGTRAILENAGPAELTLRTDAGDVATVPTSWAADYLDHGYAFTVHKAQGLTTRDALVYGTAALDQQSGYVALSRGRIANHLYTSIDTLLPDRTDDLDVPRFQLVRDTERDDIADNLKDRLLRNSRQHLAAQQRPDPNWLRAFPDDIRHQSRADDYGLSR